jgi:hypothetical protein
MLLDTLNSFGNFRLWDYAEILELKYWSGNRPKHWSGQSDLRFLALLGFRP